MVITIINTPCRLLTAKSWSARGACHQPAFMGICPTICQMCLPCPPSGQIRLNIRAWWAEKNVLCSDWKGEYVQGQFWTVVVASNNLLNFEHIINWQHGFYDVGLPPRKPWFDSPEEPNIFFVIATKQVCKNVGEGDHEVMCRWRQLALAE